MCINTQGLIRLISWYDKTEQMKSRYQKSTKGHILGWVSLGIGDYTIIKHMSGGLSDEGTDAEAEQQIQNYTRSHVG